MPNHYRYDRFGPCFGCTKGYICQNETIDLQAGFYWVWENVNVEMNYEVFKKDLLVSKQSFKMRKYEAIVPLAYACPLAQSCLGGMLSQCREGYRGPLCAVCDKGYKKIITKCHKCPSLPWLVAQIVLVILIAGVIVVVILWEGKKDERNQNKRSLTDVFLARLKIVIGFYQVSASTFDAYSYINWPGPVLTIMNYAKMVQLNLLQIAPLNCINEQINADVHISLIGSVGITALTILFGCAFNSLVRFCHRSKSTDTPQQREDWISSYKRKCYRCLVLLLFITFPSTCTNVLQVLPAACHEICSGPRRNCKSFLKADYSIQCNTPKHNIFGIMSTASLLYCIGFPLVLYMILRQQKSNIQNQASLQEDSNVILSSVKFLYENYSPKCWFWEIVELGRKMIFSTILILMPAESRLSLGLTAIFSGLYSVFFALYKPIEDTFEHWLQLASLLASSVNFFLGIMMKIPKDETASNTTNEADSIIMAVLLTTANVVVVVLVVGK